MPRSRARLGSFPWALWVRTLQRPLRSSRHRDISFNSGPASFRQDPAATFDESSSVRLRSCENNQIQNKKCETQASELRKSFWTNPQDRKWAKGPQETLKMIKLCVCVWPDTDYQRSWQTLQVQHSNKTSGLKCEAAVKIARVIERSEADLTALTQRDRAQQKVCRQLLWTQICCRFLWLAYT